MQAATAELASGELELAGHAPQVATAVAPAVTEYLSAAQLVQTVLPAVLLYFPASHTAHGPPVGPVYPALQSAHAALDVLPTGEMRPEEQLVHCADPVVVLYVSAAQGEHVLPAGPVYPASHTQSKIDPDVASVCEYDGHKLQFALPSGDHCPAGHSRHVSSPVAL